MRVQMFGVLLVTVASTFVFVGVRAEVPQQTATPALIYTSTPNYDVTAWLHGGERFPQGARLELRRDGASRVLVPEFFATADASVSFDGIKVLFGGKKSAGDHWQIWEMPLSGRDPKQLTSCPDDCVRPFYLPDKRIIYARKIDGRFQVEAAPLEDGKALPLTYVPGNAVPTDVLHDGRVLFESAYPLGEGAKAELYTVYPDGSGVESYRCDHGDSRHSGRQMSSGDIVFVNEHGLGRFTSALAHEVQLATPKGEFAGDVVEIAAGVWITSWRKTSPSAKEANDGAAKSFAPGHYSLHEWNQATGSFRTLVVEDGADAVQPQVVAPHAIPNRFPSGLHDWTGANVLCLNTYTSKLKIASGSVESVTLYTQVGGTPVLLGRAPVAEDGSFFLHVPSERPLQIELLDKAGKTVQREQGWFWMRQGEQRVCVGCHAGPERAPDNAVPQILVKSTEPADMTRSLANDTGGR